MIKQIITILRDIVQKCQRDKLVTGTYVVIFESLKDPIDFNLDHLVFKRIVNIERYFKNEIPLLPPGLNEHNHLVIVRSRKTKKLHFYSSKRFDKLIKKRSRK